jgi:predicted transcriptional regulator
MGLKINELLVGNYMSVYPISAKPEVPFGSVVSFMAESKFSTLIVMDEENPMPIGVFTERGISHMLHLVKAGTRASSKNSSSHMFQ